MSKNQISIESLKQAYVHAKAKAEEVAERYNEKVADLAKVVEEAKSNWEASNAELIEEYGFAQERAKVNEEILRDNVIAVYKETGQKDVGFGCSVRVTKSYEITDMAKAKEWVKENIPVALVVDTKQLIAYVKGHEEVLELGFMAKTEKEGAVIGK